MPSHPRQPSRRLPSTSCRSIYFPFTVSPDFCACITSTQSCGEGTFGDFQEPDAFYFDPVTGRRFDLGVVTASGFWKSPNVPSPQDWVLVMQAQKSGETVKGK